VIVLVVGTFDAGLYVTRGQGWITCIRARSVTLGMDESCPYLLARFFSFLSLWLSSCPPFGPTMILAASTARGRRAAHFDGVPAPFASDSRLEC
jgi:hypothetical protein